MGDESREWAGGPTEDSGSRLLLGKRENICEESGRLRPISNTLPQNWSPVDQPFRAWTSEAWGMNVCRLGLPQCSGWGMEGTVGLPSVPSWTSRIIRGWPLMCVPFPWQCLLYRPLTFSMTTSGEESRITMTIWTSRTSWTLFRRR